MYSEKQYFNRDQHVWGSLPEFSLPFLSPGDGKLSEIAPGKLPNWACLSRSPGLPVASSGSEVSIWGLSFSPE